MKGSSHLTGGGPAPLITNPTENGCLLAVSVNAGLFAGSIIGICYTKIIDATCGGQFTAYIMSIGLLAALAAIFWLFPYRMKLNSDVEWLRTLEIGVVVISTQVATLGWGLYICYLAFVAQKWPGTELYWCYRAARPVFNLCIGITIFYVCAMVI
eukprot:Filipodium_phascolosomae@DN7326_c0_g1_i1.p1